MNGFISQEMTFAPKQTRNTTTLFMEFNEMSKLFNQFESQFKTNFDFDYAAGKVRFAQGNDTIIINMETFRQMVHKIKIRTKSCRNILLDEDFSFSYIKGYLFIEQGDVSIDFSYAESASFYEHINFEEFNLQHERELSMLSKKVIGCIAA